MRSYYLAKDVLALADGRVRITFETGETGILDCRPFMARPFWRKLSSPAFFSLVRVEDGILTWPNDIDIAPEDVWEKTIRDPVLDGGFYAVPEGCLSVAEPGAEYDPPPPALSPAP